MKNSYLALLRGINVNGRIIKNTDLQTCFEKMGFSDIVVVLQSGNVLFTSAKNDQDELKSIIEQALEKRFKYPAKIILRDSDSLKEIIKKYPFDTANTEKQHYVVFLSEDVCKELATEKLDPKIEEIKSGDMVMYWTVTKGMTLKSVFGKLIAKAKYRDISTTRNMNTLLKIIR